MVGDYVVDNKRRLYSLTRKLIRYLEKHKSGRKNARIIRAAADSKDSSLPAAEILKNVLEDVGFSENEAKAAVRNAMKYEIPIDLAKQKKVSPSFKYYKSKDGTGTSKRGYKSVSGGVPGSGKRKS